jgi:dCTP diphosphatase
MAQFADERDWRQFHTPRNLVLALVGEVGELAELFQWRGEVAPGLPDFGAAERVRVGEEMSDVLLYLVRLADRCGVDLAAAVGAKLEANAAKYPAERARGSSAKYHAYADGGGQSGQ